MTSEVIVHHGSPEPLAVLDRVTTSEDPDSGRANHAALSFAYWQLGYGEQWQEQYYGPDKALTYSVLWACVRYISQTVAGLGWHVYQKQADGRTRLPIEENIAWTLDLQANPEVSAFDWRQTMLKDALLGGNGYAEIERNGAGRPWWLWRIDPDRVCPERDDAGRLYYRVTNEGKDDSLIAPENMFHLKGLGPDGVVGYSVVHLARQSIKLGLSEEQYGTNFFQRGPTPGGMLKIPGAMKEPDRKALQASFEKTYGGAKNAGRVVVLTGNADFSPLTLSSEDAQFLESRTFQINEICRWFGVPPHKVSELTRSTFSNIEHQSIEAVQDCLMPWCRRLETEADIKLFGRSQTGRRYTRLNLAALLRGDSATQTNNLSTQVSNGMRTVNEAREMLDLNPIDGGDTPLIHGAYTPLERVLEEPEPEPAPAAAPPGEPPPEEEDDEPEEMPESLAAALRLLLQDCYERVLRIEADKARRADNKGNLRTHAQEFYDSAHAAHVAAKLHPILAMFFQAAGRGGSPMALAATLAADHCHASLAALLADGIAGAASWCGAEDGAQARPVAQAQRHLGLIWEAICEDANGQNEE